MARPKQFKRQAALERAMDVFWTHGYERASVQNLLDGMGINRGSMYDTFGDKHALFVDAVEHYCDTVMQKAFDLLATPGSPLGNVRRLLTLMVEHASGEHTRGCLICNTAVELGQSDPMVAEAVRGMLEKLEESLHEALDRAVDAGELRADLDTRALARFLTSTSQGIMVMGKANVGAEVLQDVIKVAESVLR